MDYLRGIIAIVCALLFFGSMLYLRFGYFKFFFHNLLGWHRPDDTRELAGINLKSVCKHCGKEIMQDSQGNWFDI